jgi:hypothetical protein|tara:strand:+ start:213 stop:401 length:189 start_codon:yes stop_codon:yes gene_type:complete
MDFNLFNFFGIEYTWTFIVQLGILLCLVVIMFDINKIRDHHQYMFERKLEEQNEKLRSDIEE